MAVVLLQSSWVETFGQVLMAFAGGTGACQLSGGQLSPPSVWNCLLPPGSEDADPSSGRSPGGEESTSFGEMSWVTSPRTSTGTGAGSVTSPCKKNSSRASPSTERASWLYTLRQNSKRSGCCRGPPPQLPRTPASV